MRFLNFLREEYETRTSVFGRHIEIFSNPSRSEIIDILNQGEKFVRFCVDFKKKKIFVWNGGVIHDSVLSVLGKEKLISVKSLLGTRDKLYFLGDGPIVNGKIRVETAYNTMESDEIADIVRKNNINWLKPYLEDPKDIFRWIGDDGEGDII